MGNSLARDLWLGSFDCLGVEGSNDGASVSVRKGDIISFDGSSSISLEG